MKLTRRDALKALAAGGVTLGLSEITVNASSEPGDATLTESDFDTMMAITDVVYPSEVEVSPSFVETYLNPLSAARKSGTASAIDELNTYSKDRRGVAFADLPSSTARENVLRSLGVDTVYSDPDGPVPAQIKFYLVNSLLFALFSTPKGSRLFGIRNPAGHPGGFATYREQLAEMNNDT